MADPGSISASRDDGGSGQRRPREPRKDQRESGGAGFGTWLMIVLLLAGLGIAGWFILNQHQLLQAAAAEQASASDRIAVLEDRLRATDEVMSDTGADTREQLGFWESEIRKVWDIAYRDNRKWIKENQALLATHTDTLGSVTGQLSTLSEQLATQSEALEATELALKKLDTLGALSAQVSGIERAQAELSGQLTELNAQGLTERILRNEQAVNAIDAYRVQLNSRLNDLRDRLDAMATLD